SRGVRFWHKSCYTIPSPTCVFLRCASLLWAYGPDLALLSNALDGPLGTIRQGRPRVGGGVSWNKQPSGGRRCASLLRGAKSCNRDPSVSLRRVMQYTSDWKNCLNRPTRCVNTARK